MFSFYSQPVCILFRERCISLNNHFLSGSFGLIFPPSLSSSTYLLAAGFCSRCISFGTFRLTSLVHIILEVAAVCFLLSHCYLLDPFLGALIPAGWEAANSPRPACGTV